MNFSLPSPGDAGPASFDFLPSAFTSFATPQEALAASLTVAYCTARISSVSHSRKKPRQTDPPPPPGAPGGTSLLKAGSGAFSPDIWIVDSHGNPRVWKSWWRRPWIEKHTFGRWLARRESRITSVLQDLEGFPRFLSRPHPWTLEISLLDAEPVPELKGGKGLNAQYFARLEGLLSEMHRRGVNHGDLRRKNLLRAPGDPSTPRVVDFTQCFYMPPPRRGPRRWIFRQAVRVDRVTFLKLKSWFLGRETLTPAECEEISRIPWHLYLGRFLRKKIYRPFKHWRQGTRRKH